MQNARPVSWGEGSSGAAGEKPQTKPNYTKLKQSEAKRGSFGGGAAALAAQRPQEMEGP